MINLVSLDTSDYLKLIQPSNKKGLTIVQEACQMLDIRCIFNNKTFVDKKSYLDSNKIEGLRKTLERSFGDENYTIFYHELNRNHPRYDYYNIIGFLSLKEDDIKKILKVHKLKAFL